MKVKFFGLLLLLCVSPYARADMVTLDLPSSYTPGTAFTVNVGLTPVSNLGLYNVEVVFRTPGAIGGLLTIDPPAAATSGYVFPSPINFLASSNVSGTDYRLTLSDFTLSLTGPDVVAGVNDKITSLTVRPSTSLDFPITVFIDRSSLFIDDANGDSLLTNGDLPSGTINLNSTAAVPGPAGWVCGVLACGVLGLRWRTISRQSQSNL